MNHWICSILALLISTSCLGQSIERAEPPEPGAMVTGLAHHWGFGFDTIPGASSGGGPLVPGLAPANALDVRWWKSDRLAFEALLALGVSNGTNGAGSNENLFGLGLGAKWNWKKPSEDVLVQWLGRVSAASDRTGSAAITTVAAWLGTGFEAFIPVWRAVSIEGSTGLGLLAQDKAGNPVTLLGINGNGFVPVNVAIHYYFL